MPDQSNWQAVDDYIAERLIGDDPVQNATLASNRAAGLPEIDVSMSQGKMLQLLAQGVGAQRILEIGTLGGYSAIWLARALPEDGELVTLEVDADYAAVANANIARANQTGKVTVEIGVALDSLQQMVDENIPKFDFAFIDADKQSYACYLDYCVQLCRPGAMLIFDNVVREGEVTNPDSVDPKVPGTRALYDALHQNSAVNATAIQTVGAKKWDGFLMVIVEG
ncbi:MAG: O-methyltransferase [Sphingorhabdus sp.]